jgi:threonine dehydratase
VTITVEDIRAAAQRIDGAVYHTRCPFSLSLSRFCGCEVFCKLDHLQMTGSFKERGARNKLMLLDDAQRRRGVISASAGNHGLGLAYHGQLLSVPVTVVMPLWAPLIKVANCKSFGARVIQHGQTFDESQSHARALAAEQSLTYVPGFDDPQVIAGQGTMGLEIVADVPDVDAVIVPVGGGGLLAGVGTAVKALRPSAAVIGVEPINAPTLHESLAAGRVTRIDTKPTLADGLAVAQVGEVCFPIIKKVMDRLVLVDEAQIARAILRLLELEKMAVEGAGAVPLAALTGAGTGAGSAKGAASLGLAGKKVVLCLSGGNIDLTLISRIIERGLAADGRLCRIVVGISDRPGGLARLTAVLAATGASIKEVSHDRNFGPADVAVVRVAAVLETRDFDHIRQVHEALRAAGIEILSSDL